MKKERRKERKKERQVRHAEIYDGRQAIAQIDR
jgi:hypothetical protein